MSYQAPAWLRGAHAQTIWPLTIKGPQPALRRERWSTPDNDFIDVDLLAGRPDAPLVVLFHGLEGSARSHYARSLMRALAARGWQGAVAHFRGCSGEPNKLARAYHSGDSEEIHWILQRFAERFPQVPRHAAGVSLGGNALLCWLGRQGNAAAQWLNGAAAISAPLDLLASGHHLGRGFNKVYTEYFLRTLRRHVTEKAGRFPGLFDLEGAVRARNLAEFDTAYTAPMHGFRDAEDYWRRASSKPLLANISVPTLVLNARNDPFLPEAALPSDKDVSAQVTLEQPAEGGHVGFVTGPFPGRLDWLPQRLLAHFDQVQAAGAQA